MVMVLHADLESALSLTLARPERVGDFTPEDERLAAAVGPHLLAALRLRHQFALARSSTLLLDRFDQPVLLLTASGRLAGGNVRGQQILDSHDGLTGVHGELRGATPAQTQLLRQAVQETDRAARGASLQPRATLRLARPSGRKDLVVRASPVSPSVASTFGVGELVTVVLFIHDPEEDEPPLVQDILAQAMDLTNAEAAVAVRIWEGDGVVDAARELGISPNTVKSHLKSVYGKAGVDRQSALVRRIAMLVADMGRE